jgi:membrane protease YdiL (CAAX protease family)
MHDTRRIAAAMTLVDHLFVVALFLIQPVVSALDHRRYRAGIAAGVGPDRLRMYRDVMIVEWSAFTVVMGAWLWLGRPIDLLGFSTPGGVGFAVAAGLTFFGAVVLAVQWRNAGSMTEAQRVTMRQSFGFVGHFLPQTDRELERVLYTSVTAGIVEEVLYRGFAIWYVSSWTGVPAAVVITSVAFGLGHLYQGAAGARITGLVGLAFALLYVVSGSLWVPMAAHILLDVLQALMVREVYRRGPEAGVAGRGFEGFDSA